MIAVHIEKVKHVQAKYTSDLEDQRKNALKKLEEFKRNSRIQFSRDEKNYLDMVISHFQQKNLLVSTPEDIDCYKTKVGCVPKNSRKKGQKPLKQFIIDKLDYKGLRKTFYPKYFNDIGIKACVYCNSALTVSVEKTSSKYSARFDVDHYHPKDEFPFLSIFLFNLYPVCAPCNRRKSKSTKVKFELYSDKLVETRTSKYQFKLDAGAKSKYLLTKNVDDLDFSFEPTNNSLQTELKIKEIYDTQKDIIEELIVKKLMYDKDNRKSLYNSFTKLQLHPDLYLRTLVGNYIKKSEIHKRPMAKFMQDIARDLGIID